MATRKPAQTQTPAPSFKQNLSDDQLDDVVRELLAEGLTTVNAMSKALRGTPRGTNTRRLAASLGRVRAAEATPKRTTRTRKPTAA
jgi:hypothetical protein